MQSPYTTLFLLLEIAPFHPRLIHQVSKMDITLSSAEIEAYQKRLREEETPEPEPLDVDDLRKVWDRGNKRRPLPPNYSLNHKVDLVRIERMWKLFCKTLKIDDWKSAIRTISFQNRGLQKRSYCISFAYQSKGRGHRSTPKAQFVYIRESEMVLWRNIQEESWRQNSPSIFTR